MKKKRKKKKKEKKKKTVRASVSVEKKRGSVGGGVSA
jgi:hypothetical protein